ncbi:hypothetical protein L0B52_06335 [Suttonella sp. R2A3]|nr:hypothetical protein [Suttonella sp. R2A3]UJF23957.1 hypothetical protein L0B52_06335 [Suttonella sp. R2A3]
MKKTLMCASALAAASAAQAATGEVSGSEYTHTPTSIEQGIRMGDVALPAKATADGETYYGDFNETPKLSGERVPTVIMLHGSSGINPKLGYDTWQKHLANEGIASFIFDGMQLDDRITYKSPVDTETYEKIHELRASEIDIALNAIKATSWADAEALILAGTSEGAVSVARYDEEAFIGKIIYSWSCEDNYFVKDDMTSTKQTPTLNIISSQDKYFSDENDFVGIDKPVGNCSVVYGDELPEFFEVLLIPKAPHTLFNLPAARSALVGFVEQLLDPEQKHPIAP